MRFIIILLLVFYNLLLADERNSLTLQLAWKHQFQFAGYYMAKELGYYDDANLDVTIKEYDKGINVLKEVESNRADFGIGRSSVIISKINGSDIVALGAIFQSSPLMLLTRSDTNINDIKDLKNKKIMLSSDARNSASILAMLYSKGLTKEQVKIIPHSFNLHDLIEKRTDAMASYLSNEPMRLENQEVAYTIFHPKDYGFNFYSDILFTTSKQIKQNPKATRDFYEATLKGWKYAFDNIAKTSELIHRKYNTQNKDLITYVKEGEVLKGLAYPIEKEDIDEGDKFRLAYISNHRVEEIANVYKVLGLVNKDIDVHSFVYEHNHPELFNIHMSLEDMLWIVIALVTLFFIIIVYVSQKKWLITKGELEEEIFHKTEELKEQNRIILAQSRVSAVGEMIGNIAHQWRQPLASITAQMANLQLSLDLDDKVEKDELKNTINKVNHQCQHLSTTIDDFRNFFHANSDDVSSFNTKEAILKTVEMTKDSLNNNDIETVLELLDYEMVKNRNNFIQCILNLINNAKDAMVQNNTAKDKRYLFITMQIKEESIEISFKDSGGGIDESIIDRVFEPYLTTKHQAQGTGLGLYMTHQLITKHLEGEISVQNRSYTYDSKMSKGAEFIVKLPIK